MNNRAIDIALLVQFHKIPKRNTNNLELLKRLSNKIWTCEFGSLQCECTPGAVKFIFHYRRRSAFSAAKKNQSHRAYKLLADFLTSHTIWPALWSNQMLGKYVKLLICI